MHNTKLLLFNKSTILNHIQEENAVFYLRGIADEKSLYPIYYIGSAKKGNLKEKLFQILCTKNWDDIVYINLIICKDSFQAKELKISEIKRHKPKYNSLNPLQNFLTDAQLSNLNYY